MDLPFSVKPDKKLSVQDVMNLTRDKSYGTIFDPVQGIRGGPFQNPNYYGGTRKISVANVEYTSLVQCRPGPAQSRSAASAGWPSASRTPRSTCPSTPA